MPDSPDKGASLSQVRRRAGCSLWQNLAPEPAVLTITKVAPMPEAAEKAKKINPEKLEQRVCEITKEAVDAYNAMLAKPGGLLPAVTKISMPTRNRNVHRSIDLIMKICKEQYGDRRIVPLFWEQYFAECKADPFLSGNGNYTGSHANWLPDFEYLTRPKTIEKVFEKARSRG